jgi:hypothetical protein
LNGVDAEAPDEVATRPSIAVKIAAGISNKARRQEDR